MKKILFVCLGNICRSPTADGVLRKLVADSGLEKRMLIDSAGTGDWHIGRAPDSRTIKAAARRGYDLSVLRARLVTQDDFDEFDYILAMDKSNLAHLQKMKPAHFAGHLGLFMDFAPHMGYSEVPDPYHGDEDDFERVLDLVEEAAQHLLKKIV